MDRINHRLLLGLTSGTANASDGHGAVPLATHRRGRLCRRSQSDGRQGNRRRRHQGPARDPVDARHAAARVRRSHACDHTPTSTWRWPIGDGQTISPPFIVAYMTEQLEPQPTDKVLEIGTGSGYQAAVLSPLVKEVYSIEIVEAARRRGGARRSSGCKYDERVHEGRRRLSRLARARAVRQDHRHLFARRGPAQAGRTTGAKGGECWSRSASYQQTLYAFEKKDGKLNKMALLPMMFVPMTGAGRGRNATCCPIRASGNSQRRLRGVGDAAVPIACHEWTRSAKTQPTRQCARSRTAPWYYQRQLKFVEGNDAPEGSHYAIISNTVPGRSAQAASDGRRRPEGRSFGGLTVGKRQATACRARPPNESAPLSITFYDENRCRLVTRGSAHGATHLAGCRSTTRSKCRPRRGKPSCGSV